MRERTSRRRAGRDEGRRTATAAEDGESAAREQAPPQAGPGPDQGLVDDAYDDFLRRYGQEQGERAVALTSLNLV